METLGGLNIPWPSSSSDSLRLPDPALLDRIQTYQPFLWFSKPKSLSPPVCALNGWVCEAKDTLVCQKCQR
jgi:hypothetical protein